MSTSAPVLTPDVARLIDRLVTALDPDRIVLFGSRARGDHRPDSDIDLLVIKPSDQPIVQRLLPAYAATASCGVARDLLWYTPEEIDDWAGVVNHITYRALHEGQVVYQKGA